VNEAVVPDVEADVGDALITPAGERQDVSRTHPIEILVNHHTFFRLFGAGAREIDSVLREGVADESGAVESSFAVPAPLIWGAHDIECRLNHGRNR